MRADGNPASVPGPSGLAVDFGGTKIAATRLREGEVDGAREVATDGDATPAAQLDAIEDLLASLALKPDDRVGVAVAGRVDAAGRWHALNTETLAQITRVPLRAALSARLSRPVRVENDATAAAIGEYHFGAGRGTRNFAFLTVSTGVGGGLILDGRPVVSASGLAGHVGFTTSTLADRRCGSGRMNTVESRASGRAIAAYAAAAGYPGLSAKQVYEANLSGEGWARALIDTSAAAVAELCANLKSLIDPDRIAIGGSIGLAEGYIDRVRAHLAGEPEIFRVPVVPTGLGRASALYGVLADRD
ncbi:MAG: N-acetylmannosamine kinase [Rhodobacterales bacterium]|nr:MAG: N-acetylmannosamine kinase [Rhodobacterales bacterium]